jgi:hypothetical protein
MPFRSRSIARFTAGNPFPDETTRKTPAGGAEKDFGDAETGKTPPVMEAAPKAAPVFKKSRRENGVDVLGMETSLQGLRDDQRGAARIKALAASERVRLALLRDAG